MSGAAPVSWAVLLQRFGECPTSFGEMPNLFGLVVRHPAENLRAVLPIMSSCCRRCWPIFRFLHRAGQFAEDLFSRSIGDLGITARQYIVLSVVDGLDDPSQTTLCEVTGIDRSTMADMVPRLV